MCAGLSEATVRALDTIRPVVLERVVGPHFHRPNISSAGFYVQKSDFADESTHNPFCEVRMTGVSLTDDRCYNDFIKAHYELVVIYTEVLRATVPLGQKVELFVVLMVDGQPKPGVSLVIESPEITVTGQLSVWSTALRKKRPRPRKQKLVRRRR